GQTAGQQTAGQPTPGQPTAPVTEPVADRLADAPGHDRLAGRVALVVGGGQTPGLTVGNGRAAAVVYAREGALVLVADLHVAAAEETVEQIAAFGGEAHAWQADVTDERAVAAMIEGCCSRHGRIDVLHNNVGAGLAAGDAAVGEITPEAFDRVIALNLRAATMCCKHALGPMRRQGSGVITNISSFAVLTNYPYVAYKTSKAGVVALTQHVAMQGARFGVRANVVLPGQINTPMAVDSRVGVLAPTREEVIMRRDAEVPLGARMGTAWDVAYACLFLASDEARFITGVSLVVDGGQSLKVG
ncbi:MAG TPA: SDR family NAD(P)-dependent oxidoreductase, partial [Acidimicrobiales bacterium]|nr:SDR family NAD(P)-dependent oxidoreductase [Acidimicrobiales bacterium]